MLARTAREAIQDILRKSRYGEDAFSFREFEGQTRLTGREPRPTFRIDFKYQGGFFFDLVLMDVMDENSAEAPRFRVEYSPGTILLEKERGFVGPFDEALLALIPQWLNRIDFELIGKTTGVNEDDGALQQMFIEGFAVFIGDGTGHFTESEKEDIYRALDQLKERMVELLRRFEDVEEKITALQSEIDSLKANTELPKGIWARVSASKFSKIVMKFFSLPEVQKFIAEGAKRLLGWSGGGEGPHP